MSKTNLELNMMPQVAHRNAVLKRDRLHQVLNVSLNILEIFFVSAVFIFLYFYRLSNEFGVSLWSTYGLSLALPRIAEYTIFFIIVITLSVLWMAHYKLFISTSQYISSYLVEAINCSKAITYSVLITIGLAFIFKLEDYSRFVIVMFIVVSVTGLIALRGARRLITFILAKKGLFVRNVIIIGAGRVGTLISSELMTSINYNVVGFVDDHKKGNINGVHVLGALDQIDRIINRYPIDEIIITIPKEKELIHSLIAKYRKYNVLIRIVPEMFNLVTKTVEVERMNSIPYITLIKTPMRGIPYLIKRSFDVILSVFAIIMTSPIFIATATLIKLESRGKVFYKQIRVGRNGKLFKMYKFRSMVENADELKNKLQKFNEVNGAAFKMKKDPRITKVGSFIRKYSIDELPQLVNVLRGEMSLVGPRPPIPSEVEQYSDWEWRRLEVVPGITGLWQVSGRSELSFNQWVNLDIYYIENWSLGLDIKILLKTVPTVIKGEGAY